VLASFSRDFEEFSDVRHVVLSKTFQVRLLIDECLSDKLGGLEFPRRLVNRIYAPSNIMAEIVALLSCLRHMRRRD
jgi:hypothetical protein